MSNEETALRADIVAHALRMNEIGINQGTSGNVSARWQEGCLITPTGVPYEELEARDIVFLDRGGAHDERQSPSSEWRFHLHIYRHRPEIHAIVHTHSMYATALSIKGLSIPAVHYMIAAAGGPSIRCAPYATFGSEELSHHALAALEDRSACLLANHGVIATGPSLFRALWLAKEVEVLAHQYYITLQLGGGNILPDAEIERVKIKMRDYGPRRRSSAS